MEAEIINKVAQSGLISFDLADYYQTGERVIYDLKDNLFHGLILKEKDFREFLKNHDWQTYQGKNVAIVCTADAVVPTWAYMLLALQLQPHANFVVYGNLETLENALFQKSLATINLENFGDKKVVVKGCGDLPIPTFAYTELTRLLLPVVASLMFGEPCSTVPLYKKINKAENSNLI
jgi:Protein of unknown function (DUF2480)